MTHTTLTITGNVGSADLKFTPAGRAVLEVTVAVNRRRFNRDTQQWEDAGTDWHRATLWGDKAEAAAETVTKGTRVIVVGDLRSRGYETREGEKRTAWEIAARDIGVIPRTPLPTPAQDDPWANEGAPF